MLARLLLVSTTMWIFSACSLVLDKRADQCASDGDCARFTGTVCDVASHLCIIVSGSANQATGTHADAGSTRNDASDGSSDGNSLPCRGPNGCYQCNPTADVEYGNRCTESPCKPFDNRARLKRLLPEGGLRPLPEGGRSPLSE
jgi:hypothetical protein